MGVVEGEKIPFRGRAELRRDVIPDIRYAKSADVSLAHQVFGAGEADLVLAPGYISNLEANWEEPNYAGFLERLASGCCIAAARASSLHKRSPGRLTGRP